MNIQHQQAHCTPQTVAGTLVGGAQHNAYRHQVYYTPDGNMMHIQGETIRIFVPSVSRGIRQTPTFLSQDRLPQSLLHVPYISNTGARPLALWGFSSEVRDLTNTIRTNSTHHPQAPNPIQMDLARSHDDTTTVDMQNVPSSKDENGRALPERNSDTGSEIPQCFSMLEDEQE